MKFLKHIAIILFVIFSTNNVFNQNQKWLIKNQFMMTFEFLDTGINIKNKKIITIQISLTNLSKKAVYITSFDFYQRDFIYPSIINDSCIIEIGEDLRPVMSDVNGTQISKLIPGHKYKLTKYIYLENLTSRAYNTSVVVNYIDNYTVIKRKPENIRIYVPKGKKRIRSPFYIYYADYKKFGKNYKFTFSKK